jgi:hypothetical protein
MQPFTLAAWQHRNAFTYEGAAKALGLCRAAYARHLKLEREGKPLPKMLVLACKYLDQEARQASAFRQGKESAGGRLNTAEETL